MNAIGTNRWVPVGSGCGRAMVSPRPGRRRLAAGGVRSTQAGGGGGAPAIWAHPCHRVHTHDSVEF